MSTIVVTFPSTGLVLSNQNFGEGFWLVDIENWFDGVGGRLFNESRPDGDGDFDQSPIYGEARYPIVVGRVAYQSEASLWAARDQVSRLWGLRDEFEIQVQSPEGTQYAQVTRAGKPTWNLWVGPGMAEFEIPLKASDSRKYGALKSLSTGLPVAGGGVQSPVISPFTELGGGSPGRVVITNNGSTDTFPVIKVTGGLSLGVEIVRVETGERLQLDWPLNTANTAEFDTANGQVWLDGQSPITGYLSQSQWWSLGAGEAATIQFNGLGAVTGTPTMTVEWRDADA